MCIAKKINNSIRFGDPINHRRFNPLLTIQFYSTIKLNSPSSNRMRAAACRALRCTVVPKLHCVIELHGIVELE